MTQVHPARPAIPARPDHHHHGFSDRTGVWVVAVAFVIATGFTVITTPLWTIYQQIDGFNTFMVTVAYATFPVGVLVSLLLAGHISDWMGRRTIALPGLLLEAVAAALFVCWNALPVLLVARFITGLGLGMFATTATAHIVELHARAHPGRDRLGADILATAANIGGFGVGVLVTSALVQWLPDPTTTSFVVYLVLLLLAAVAVAQVPETVASPTVHHPYRPQRVHIPPAARAHYFAAAAIALASFAVLGLFTSLVPAFVEGQLHYTAPLVAGVVVFVTFISAAILQIGIRRLSATAATLIGLVLYVAGFAAVVAGIATVSLPVFLIGGILAGGAAGSMFCTAISAAGQLAAPENRGEALAGIFVSSYIGLVVPVIGLGAATVVVGMRAALTGFAVICTAIAVIGSGVFIQRARPASRTGRS